MRAQRRHGLLHTGDVTRQGGGGGSLPPFHHELAELAAKGSAFWKTVAVVLDGEALPSPGGTPIKRAGRMIGAIGCGGGTGEQDQQCADAGAAAVK